MYQNGHWRPISTALFSNCISPGRSGPLLFQRLLDRPAHGVPTYPVPLSHWQPLTAHHKAHGVPTYPVPPQQNHERAALPPDHGVPTYPGPRGLGVRPPIHIDHIECTRSGPAKSRKDKEKAKRSRDRAEPRTGVRGEREEDPSGTKRDLLVVVDPTQSNPMEPSSATTTPHLSRAPFWY